MDGVDWLSREVIWASEGFPGTIANMRQGEFLPEATMHGLLDLYRTCSKGC